MTRTNRFLYGVGWGYANQIAMAAAGLYLTRFYLHHLGETLYGLWIVGLQVLTYLALMDLGIVALLPRETAAALGKDRASIAPLVGQTIWITTLQAPVFSLVGLATLWFLPFEWASLRAPLTITLIAYTLLFPLRTFAAALQGVQDFHFLGKIQFTAWGAGALVGAAGVYFGWGLFAMAAGWLVVQAITAVACGWRLSHAFPDLLPKRLAFPKWRDARARYQRSLWVTLNQVSSCLLAGAEVLVLGKVMGPAAVVIYACTGKLVQLLVNQPQTIAQSAFPALAELRAAADREAIRRVSTALLLSILLTSGWIGVSVLGLNGGFVRWWLGDSRYGGELLTGLLVANMCLRHLGTALVYSLFSFGHEKLLAFVGIADGLLTLGLAWWLTPKLGLLGPIAALLVSALLTAIPVCLHRLGRELGGGLSGVLTPLAPWALRMTVFVAAAVTMASAYPPRGWIAVAMAAVTWSAAYGLGMLPVLRRSVLQRYVQPLWDRTREIARRRAP